MIPDFLGIENPKETPYAEMWMGTHSGAPSKVTMGGKPTELKDISGELPFLFKVLGVEKPLSIQAHPNKEKAREGFRREQESGLALNALRRNYKDANHKPEIICAITPFTLMAGFREPAEIHRSLEDFLTVLPQLKEIIYPLLRALDTGSLAVFFRNLFCFSSFGREYLSNLISEKRLDKTTASLSQEQWDLMKKFACQYPGDPAIFSPLYLNLVTLKPMQAIYVPDGVLHAYISGFGVELMAASDNVLRGGLTPKYVDIPELMNIVNFIPFNAQILSPASLLDFHYFCPCDDFSLSIMRGEGENEKLYENGSAVCLVVDGELSTGDILFKKGESFFIPETTESIFFKGNYTLFTAASGVAASGII